MSPPQATNRPHGLPFLCIQDAMLWGAIFAFASVGLFVIAVAGTLVFEADLMGLLATGYKYIAMWLIDKGLIHSENIGGALLVGHVFPWLTVGVLFGVARRLVRPDRQPPRTETAAISTVVVAVILLTALLVLWW